MRYCSSLSKTILPLLFLFVSFMFPSQASAATTQIFDNQVFNILTDSGKFYWLASDGTYNQIYVYDQSTGITTHTTSAYDKGLNSVSGNKVAYKDILSYPCGSIVCQGFSVYDLSTDTKVSINALDNTYSNPQIEGNKVVWMTFGTYDSNTPSVYLYDLTTDTTTLLGDSGGGINNNPFAYFPQINQGKIMWNNNGIYLYDIASQTTTQVSSGGARVNNKQQLDNGKIVWLGFDSDTSRYQVFLYDTVSSTTTRLTNYTNGAAAPRINNGKVAWAAHDGNDTEIYLYDLTSQNITQVTNNTVDDIRRDEDSKLILLNGKVLWSYMKDPVTQGINVYDIATADTSTLSPDTDINGYLTYDGDYGTWSHSVDGSSYEVLLWDGQIDDPVTVSFSPTHDTYVKSGRQNRNTGAGTFMKLQSSGENRSLVRFDHAAMLNQIGNAQILSAKLRVTITENGNNWSNNGRTIDVHRLLANWTEGNGTENDKGTGNGATWACAIDSNIDNTQKNCSGITEWEMGQPNNPSVHPWAQIPTDTKTITNNQTGVVEFNVTSDVTSFLNGTNTDYGWILKKTDEGLSGRVNFGTKESASDPELVVTYQP